MPRNSLYRAPKPRRSNNQMNLYPYSDPDAASAENLAKAAYYLYEAHWDDTARAVTEQICKLFENIPVDKSEKKTLGQVTYYPAGLIQASDATTAFNIPAPRYTTISQTEKEFDKTNATMLKKAVRDQKLPWMITQQIQAAIDGKPTPSLKAMTVMHTLLTIQQLVNLAETCDNKQLIIEIGDKIENALGADKMIYYNPYEYRPNDLGQSLYDYSTFAYRLQYLGKDAIDELEDAMQKHKNMAAINLIRGKHKPKYITWKPLYEEKIRSITKAIRNGLDAAFQEGPEENISNAPTSIWANAPVSAAEAATIVDELQRAYKALSNAQDDWFKEILTKADVIKPDVTFPDDLFQRTALTKAKATALKHDASEELVKILLNSTEKVLNRQTERTENHEQ